MTHTRRNRVLLIVAFVFLTAFIVGAGGATPRYNRIVYGGAQLAIALLCFGSVAYLRGSDLRRRASMGLAMGCWLLAAVVLAVWIRPSLAGAVRPESRRERAHALLTLPTDRLREALFAELQPVQVSQCRLQRFGGPNDGGYLMCANLLGSIRTGYSYGIGGFDQWGCDVSREFDVRVHQYDCFDLTKPACAEGVMVFHAECIGPLRHTDRDGRLFDTFENQFTTNGDENNHVVVKMDVEGAEWETLLRAPAAVLERIDQLVVEFHGVGQEDHLTVVRRLKHFFHVAHLHFNNHACSQVMDPFPARVYEVLFVNKRIATAEGAAAVRPHPLDRPNRPDAGDCQTPTTQWTFLKHALENMSLMQLVPWSTSSVKR